MIDRSQTLIEVAATVAEHLRRAGIATVLVGGSSITAHEPSIYTSRDADFTAAAYNADLAPPMTALGFEKFGLIWSHPQSDYTVQFVSGNPAVGSREIRQFVKVTTACGTLETLSVEDAVTDRLIKYLVWDDRQAREVALAVIRKRTSLDIRAVTTHLWPEAPTPQLKLKLETLVRMLKEGAEKQSPPGGA